MKGIQVGCKVTITGVVSGMGDVMVDLDFGAKRITIPYHMLAANPDVKIEHLRLSEPTEFGAVVEAVSAATGATVRFVRLSTPVDHAWVSGSNSRWTWNELCDTYPDLKVVFASGAI